MAFLSQFIPLEEVTRLTDAQVDQLAEHVNFVVGQQATSNAELKSAIEKVVKPVAHGMLKG